MTSGLILVGGIIIVVIVVLFARWYMKNGFCPNCGRRLTIRKVQDWRGFKVPKKFCPLHGGSPAY